MFIVVYRSFCLTCLLVCNCNQDLNWSSLLSVDNSSDMEVDVVGAVIEVSSRAASERFVSDSLLLLVYMQLLFCAFTS